MKNSKRAFTIVELVIVIAVIAILAAVLIPTFSGLIEKANVNSDQAAVKQMNTYLAADEQINGPAKTYDEALKVLNKSNLDANNYVALAAGYKIIYVPAINRVLYIDENSTVVYPEEYVNNPIVADEKAKGYWFTLSGSLIPDDTWKSLEYTDLSSYNVTKEDAKGEYSSYYGDAAEDVNLKAYAFRNDKTRLSGTATYKSKDGSTYTFVKVKNGPELLSFNGSMNKFSKETAYKETKNYTLFLSQDIDLANSDWKPVDVYGGNIDGKYVDASNELKSAVISNLNLSSKTGQVSSYYNNGVVSEATSLNYYYGFISVFKGNVLKDLTFKDYTIEKPGYDTISSLDKTIQRGGQYAATVCGLISPEPGSKVEISNIKIEGGTVISAQRAAGMFGAIGVPIQQKDSNGKGINVDCKDAEITFKKCVNGADVVSLSDIDGVTSPNYSTSGGIICKLGSYADNFNVKFIECENKGDISGSFAAGFIATVNGKGINVEFENCKNTGNIKGTVINSSTLGENDPKWISSQKPLDTVQAAGFVVCDSVAIDSYEFTNCQVENCTISIVQEGKIESNPNYLMADFIVQKKNPSVPVAFDAKTVSTANYLFNINMGGSTSISLLQNVDGSIKEVLETVSASVTDKKISVSGNKFQK